MRVTLGSIRGSVGRSRQAGRGVSGYRATDPRLTPNQPGKDPGSGQRPQFGRFCDVGLGAPLHCGRMAARRTTDDRGIAEAEGKIERLRVELEAPASPKHVFETAQMFRDALDAVAPDLHDGDVTLVIRNRDLRSELRGHGPAGRSAVGHVGDLLENPSQKVQAQPNLYVAATTIAKRLEPLTAFLPRIYRGRSSKVAAVLGENYVKSLRAIGEAIRPNDKGMGFVGDTVVYSPVLRFGRSNEHGSLSILIRMGGSLVTVKIEQSHARVCADLTVSGKQVPMRVSGKWEESKRGILELKDLTLVSIDRTFEAWTGADLFRSACEHADAFKPDDFDRMLDRLRDIRGD
jgi:hypothetical protein